MTPRHILSFAVVVFVVFLGLVGIIDALEPGHTLSAVEASELGVVAYRRLMDRRNDAADDDDVPEDDGSLE